MDKQLLKRQIEKIIDQGKGNARSVIVQMKVDEERTKAIINVASQAARNRQLVTNARSLIPPNAKALKLSKNSKRSSASSRTLREANLSAVAQLALNVGINSAWVVGFGNKALQTLFESNFFKNAIVNIATKSAKSSKEKMSRPQSFPFAASTALELSVESLNNLLKDKDINRHVQGVYPNRRLQAPPIMKVNASSLPAAIQDNKASSWGINVIGALGAWGAYGSRGKGIKIGLLDTGVDAKHPDLKGKVSSFAEFSASGAKVPSSAPYDSGKHGTHCAGTLVGGNATGQWIGVAPEAKVAVGLVLKNGWGTDAQILAGMQWAIDQKVDVISMSLGGLSFEPDVYDTYTQMIISANLLGIPVITAIGNDGNQTSGAPGSNFFAFSVGATDYADRVAGFSGGRTQVVWESNYIDEDYLPLVYQKPDVSAPGVAVKSCIPKNGYDVWNGTSMATPHVAGAIALLLSNTDIKTSVKAEDRAYLLQELIASSVEELGETGQDHRYGLGRIDVLRAVGFAKENGY